MSAEDNKSTVLKWVEASNRGDTDLIMTQLSDDFMFKGMARRPEWLQYRWNKDEFAKTPGAQQQLLATPINFKVVGMIAEGDQVSLEATSDAVLKNGKKYDNAYNLVFMFKDGKISEVREYSCSYLVAETFGEFNPDSPSLEDA